MTDRPLFGPDPEATTPPVYGEHPASSAAGAVGGPTDAPSFPEASPRPGGSSERFEAPPPFPDVYAPSPYGERPGSSSAPYDAPAYGRSGYGEPPAPEGVSAPRLRQSRTPNPYATNPYAATDEAGYGSSAPPPSRSAPSGTPLYASAPVPYGVGSPYNAMAVRAPFGVDPVSGLPYSDKSKVVAGLLGVFLGTFGVGRFYTGHIGMGIAQILVTWLTLGIGAIWPFIDGIVMLAGSPRDAQGRPLRP